MAAGSPLFLELPLAEHGLDFLQPELPLAHPLDGGEAAVLARSLEETADGLGKDGRAWRRLLGPIARGWDRLAPELLAPLHIPRAPLRMARFGLHGLQPAAALAAFHFSGERARALFAGLAGHSMLPLEATASAAIALVLGAAGHAVGWPIPRGGAQAISDALAGHLRALGGEIETGRWVRSVAELPPARAYLLDVTPRQLVALAGDRLPARYLRRLLRYRYGPGVFKVDWALAGPIPWRAEACRRAGTVHLGGTLEEIAAAEADVARGGHPERPYVLLAQPTLEDPSRAPAGRHVGWAYCHVPNGSREDRTAAIEAQVERFAPGFREQVLARHTTDTAAMEAYDPNYVGGDINGGIQDLGQLFTRPVARLVPYSTPNPEIWICSSSTPPGGGVHGMCGYHAARAVLRRGR
jgi:phytoene dehydrogenase-like protein